MDNPLRIRVGDHDVIFTDPGKARAAGRDWKKMADELSRKQVETPEVTLKIRELRARTKAVNDWARRVEDATPAEPKTEPAPAARETSSPPPEPSPSRRRAAATLTATGIRKGAKGAVKARGKAKKAARRYEAAGGAQVVSGGGEFIAFFFGSLVALVLLEDLVSAKGSAAFAKATGAAATVAHKIIAPVPIIQAPGG